MGRSNRYVEVWNVILYESDNQYNLLPRHKLNSNSWSVQTLYLLVVSPMVENILFRKSHRVIKLVKTRKSLSRFEAVLPVVMNE